MKSEHLDKLNDEIIKLAIKNIDKEEVAKKLTKKLQDDLITGFNGMVENSFNFEYWISEELQDSNTAAGKVFNKAVNQIVKRMAEAI